MNNYHKK